MRRLTQFMFVAPFLVLLWLMLSGCVSRQPSPLSEMMALNAKGEVACVRMGVLVRGKEGCK